LKLTGLTLDPTLRHAERDGVPLSLRPLEFDLLLYLFAREGVTVSADELCAVLWPGKAARRSRLTVHLHNLREALRGNGASLLHTVTGGYVLSAVPPAGARRVRHRCE
jgi:DNA-binding response OmpR family regulator